MLQATNDANSLDANVGTCDILLRGRGVEGCQLGQRLPRGVRGVGGYQGV